MLANVCMQYNTPLALAQLAPCGGDTILKLILIYCILPFLLVVCCSGLHYRGRGVLSVQIETSFQQHLVTVLLGLLSLL